MIGKIERLLGADGAESILDAIRCEPLIEVIEAPSECIAVIRNCVFVIVNQRQLGEDEAPSCFRILGLQCTDATEALDRQFAFTRLLQCAAEREVSFREVWSQRNGSSIARNGIIEATQGLEYVSEVE
jgi:hypothetical protein